MLRSTGSRARGLSSCGTGSQLLLQAVHSSILAWRIPWREKPGGLPSMGLHRKWCRELWCCPRVRPVCQGTLCSLSAYCYCQNGQFASLIGITGLLQMFYGSKTMLDHLSSAYGQPLIHDIYYSNISVRQSACPVDPTCQPLLFWDLGMR